MTTQIKDEALNVLETLEFVKTTEGGYENPHDDQENHDLLNEECTHFQTLCGQDCWSFGDGSYITRGADDYFHGEDISDFEQIDADASSE